MKNLDMQNHRDRRWYRFGRWALGKGHVRTEQGS